MALAALTIAVAPDGVGKAISGRSAFQHARWLWRPRCGGCRPQRRRGQAATTSAKLASTSFTDRSPRRSPIAPYVTAPHNGAAKPRICRIVDGLPVIGTVLGTPSVGPAIPPAQLRVRPPRPGAPTIHYPQPLVSSRVPRSFPPPLWVRFLMRHASLRLDSWMRQQGSQGSCKSSQSLTLLTPLGDSWHKDCVTDQPNKISVWILAALKGLSVNLSAKGVPAALIAYGLIAFFAARGRVPTLEFSILIAFLAVVSLTLVVSAHATELRKNRPPRPVIIQQPNRHTELCRLAQSHLAYNRYVPAEILSALKDWNENEDMIRVNDDSTIRQELPVGGRNE